MNEQTASYLAWALGGLGVLLGIGGAVLGGRAVLKAATEPQDRTLIKRVIIGNVIYALGFVVVPLTVQQPAANRIMGVMIAVWLFTLGRAASRLRHHRNQ